MSNREADQTVADVSIENGELPEGWAKTQLGDLVSPSKEKIEPSESPDAPYLSLEHVEGGTNRIISRGVGSDAKSTKAVYRPGDVLYGKLRPYLNKVRMPDFEGICSTDFLVFNRTESLHSRFLMYFLSRADTVEFANHHSSGIELPRVGWKSLAKLNLPLPPLAEQRRIVAQVEALLAKVNAARERLAGVPAILRRFRQSVLAAACSGQFTADWREEHPDVEPASALTERITTLRKERCAGGAV